MDTYNSYNQPPVYGGYQRQVSFGEAVKMALNKYCDFSGRASRSEYWWYILFTIIVSAATSFLDLIADSSVISGLVGLALLLPGLGLVWRRLHDIGKGGGWYFIVFIPVVGWIILIVWLCKESEMSTNRFGAIPNWESTN